jgi:ABC-type transport system substrate-binding protein
MNMSHDGEAFADVIENRANFLKDGLDNSVAFNTTLSPAWNGYWVDPKGKDFGPNSKYYEHNVAEAKKLLAAAGIPNGGSFDFFYNREATYGPVYARQVEIYTAMWADIGLKANLQGLPYATWLPQYHYGYIPSTYNAGTTKGFTGVGLGAERQRYTPVLSVYGLVHPEGDAFHGASPDGNNWVKGDPKVNDTLAKLRQETDKAKVQSGLKEMQQYLAQQAYYIPKPSNSIPFTVVWPALANYNAFTSSPVGASRWAEHNLAWWIDQSKPPFTKS